MKEKEFDHSSMYLKCVMDEEAVPYEENENPFQRTKEDDNFDELMIKKYNLLSSNL